MRCFQSCLGGCWFQSVLMVTPVSRPSRSGRRNEGQSPVERASDVEAAVVGLMPCVRDARKRCSGVSLQRQEMSAERLPAKPSRRSSVKKLQEISRTTTSPILRKLVELRVARATHTVHGVLAKGRAQVEKAWRDEECTK